MCRDLCRARWRSFALGTFVLGTFALAIAALFFAGAVYAGAVNALLTTPAAAHTAQAQADDQNPRQPPIDRTLLLRSWQFVRGNPIYSAFELSEQDGEREFYEWSAGLFAGQGHWRWLDGNRIEITANNDSPKVLQIISVSADTLTLQLVGSSELSYFVPLVEGAAGG